MATISNTPRPGYVWDATDNVWYPIGVGAHQHTNAVDTPAVMPYSTYAAAGKNKIINGDFGIWQRGTSFTPALNTFLADRFKTYMEGSGTTRSVTQQTFTLGTAPVSGYEGRFFLRYAQTVGPSAAIGNNLIWQSIEDVRTFAGQTVTFSFWAKAAATTVLDSVYAYQTFGTGGSPSGNVQTFFANSLSIGTSWTRYSFTAAIPSISGKTIGTNNDSTLDIRLNFPLGSGNTFTVDTWGWQVEASSTVTAFQTATGNPASELAACQRYYYRATSAGNVYTVFGFGYADSTTTVLAGVPVPTYMRVWPTSVDYANLAFQDGSPGAIFTFTGLSANGGSGASSMNNNITFQLTGLSGLTANRPGRLLSNNSTSGYLGFSAEL
jgi:hypothetical protein